MMPLAFIAAVSEGNVLGKDNALPWHHPEDLKHFRATTLGHAIIQGRKTYESVGKPLPGRRNLVVTRDPSYRAEGCEVLGSPEEAVARARDTDPCPFVLGGETIYRALLPLATLVHLTRIAEHHEGDAFFPELDPREWKETSSRIGTDPRLTFLVYERV
jgi:dihydrofolate reductase